MSANLDGTMTAHAVAVGNLTDLEAGEVLLPSFVLQEEDGLYVDLQQRVDAAELPRFVDRVAAAGNFFVGLDYAALSRLLYPLTPLGAPAPRSESGRIRIAAALQRFLPERQALYKGVKLTGRGAGVEYLFTPVQIERVVQRPVVGVDEDGETVVTGFEEIRQSEAAVLDSDEFIIALWSRNVRAGIDVATVRAAIAAGTTERVVVARRSEPKVGADATVSEETTALHRDDSPAILPNGKIDLRHFKNRFPQVAAGTRLLKKIPRRFGECGIEVSGTLIEPPAPRDFNIETLAGPGTRIERSGDGESIVAARDGFVDIDMQSQVISVTEKIVNRAGVSIRTTGDLALSGDEFEEHGEVQERRVVQGLHMSFHADVFGRIVSRGGRVHLHATLAGGRIENPQGRVVVDGRTTRSVIDAAGGEVAINLAESVSLIARLVHIRHAVACDVVADEVMIDEALACAIVARRIQLRQAGSHRHVETLITVCVPDLSAIDRRCLAAAKAVRTLEQRVATQQKHKERWLAMPEVQSYLAAAEHMRAGVLTLTAAQEMQWQQATQKLARPLAELRTLDDELAPLLAQLARRREERAALEQERTLAAGGISCCIDKVSGEVTVQMRLVEPGVALFPGLTPQDMKQKLRDPRARGERLFSGSSGRFEWVWTPPTLPD